MIEDELFEDVKHWKGRADAAETERNECRAHLAMRNSDIQALVKALEGIAEYCSGDDTTLGALHRLASIRNTAINVLAHVGSSSPSGNNTSVPPGASSQSADCTGNRTGGSK